MLRRAFTLMELMIVIAILGVLITLAVPSFKKAQISARWRKCQSNMKTLEGALDNVASEHDEGESDIPANIKKACWDDSAGKVDITQTEMEYLLKFGYIKHILKCPISSQVKYQFDTDKGEMYCPFHKAYRSAKNPYTNNDNS